MKKSRILKKTLLRQPRAAATYLPSSADPFLKESGQQHLVAALCPSSVAERPTFGPLVSTCARYGIKRGMAFELARQKVLKTFLLSRKRFVLIASIEALAGELGHE